MAASASNHKDTYRATAVFLALMGVLYLIDRLVGFNSLGLPWVMQKDTMLLYAAIVFLWFKSDVWLLASGGIAADRHIAVLAFFALI